MLVVVTCPHGLDQPPPAGAVEPGEQIPLIDIGARIGHINRELNLVVGGLAHCLG